MPGHIFDTNTLRNFLLVDALDMVTKACPGRLYMARTVEQELELGSRQYPKQNEHQVHSLPWREYAARFQQYKATLTRVGWQVIGISESGAHVDQLELFSCFADEDLVDLGEAESIALAAYRGLTFYSDDLAAKRAVDDLAAGKPPCPRPGNPRPPHPVQVHSTAWLLLAASSNSSADTERAEALFDEMRYVWTRHPGLGLAELRAKPGGYW